MTDQAQIQQGPEELTKLQMRAILARKKLEVIKLCNPGIVKHGFNEQQNYPYAQASDVKKEVGAAMAMVGLALSVTMADDERETLTVFDPTKRMPPVRLTVRFLIDLIDCETGYAETCHWKSEISLYNNDDKGFNKTSTQAVKYFLMATFLIGTKEDDEQDHDGASVNDSDTSTKRRNNQQKPPQPRNTNRPPLTNGNGDPRDVPVPMLSATDGKKWPGFLDWAKGAFGMERDAVLAALRDIAPEPAQFSGERPQAQAAVLAAAAKHDMSKVEAAGKDKQYVTPDVIQRAIAIAKNHKAITTTAMPVVITANPADPFAEPEASAN